MRQPPAESREKDALRIQAAAVAAQQAALTEQELGVQQRHLALEQQESQLAAHLEDKRRRLQAVREQARRERAGLVEERATHEQRLAVLNADLARAQADVADSEQQVRSERQRLLRLRQRLKRRWHRHWAAERAALREQAEELAGQRRRLVKEAEELQDGRAALDQDRLRFNGEAELGRRQLQAGWDQLGLEQQEWQAQREEDLAQQDARCRDLDERESAVAAAMCDLGAEKKQWEETRLTLQQEIKGLESRIANQRAKLSEQERELTRLRPPSREQPSLPVPAVPPPAPSLPPPTVQEDAEERLPPFVRFTWTGAPRLEQERQRLRQREADLQQGVAALAQLYGELADQRWHLAEQAERLVRARQAWEEERKGAAAELEMAALALYEREQELLSKDRALQAATEVCEQRRQELAQLRCYVDGWQSRLTARTASCEAEHDRRLIDLRTREDLAVRQLAAVAAVRQRWLERRRQEVDRLRVEHAANAKLRQEGLALRKRWLRRLSLLQQAQHRLAQQAQPPGEPGLVLGGRHNEPTLTDEDVQRLRRLTAVANAAAQLLARERQALAAESAALEDRSAQIEKRWAQLLLLEENLGKRVTAWEGDRLLARSEAAKMRQELHSLRGQRGTYESQLATLTAEVERLIQFLLEDAGSLPRPIGQAA